MSVVNPFLQQCPSASVNSLSTFLSPSHSSPSLRVSVKCTISCCCVASPVTVVNGNIDTRVPQRNEIRLGLPSKGRMASDTLDLLRDCQLSVRQVNPRQYVANIPQMGIADAIVDLVSCGTTLRENNLKDIEGGVILESQVNPFLTYRACKTMYFILERLEAHLKAVGQFTIGGSGVLVKLLTYICDEETPRWIELLSKLGL